MIYCAKCREWVPDEKKHNRKSHKDKKIHTRGASSSNAEGANPSRLALHHPESRSASKPIKGDETRNKSHV